MKTLLVHCFYNEKGGEDTVFRLEEALMNKDGENRSLTFKNKPGWRGLLQFFCSIWNISSAGKLRREIRDFQPDLVHLHNWHYALGPLAIRTARKMRVPVIVTLHNYRLLCPSATFYDGRGLFLKSLKQAFPWSAVKSGIYRNSRILTFWLAFVNWFHQKIHTWEMVDRYLVLTEFGKRIYLKKKFGIGAERILVKPNFISQREYWPIVRNDDFLFVGRLSREKGLRILLEAFANSKYTLRIIGDGPMKKEVEDISKTSSNILFLGYRDQEFIRAEMRKASILVFPSVWYEGMPLTILEAFSNGLPVIASDIGAMSTMISHGKNGLHFRAGDALDLAEWLRYWMELSPHVKQDFYDSARLAYLLNYTPEKNREQLLSIYRSVVTECAHELSIKDYEGTENKKSLAVD